MARSEEMTLKKQISDRHFFFYKLFEVKSKLSFIFRDKNVCVPHEFQKVWWGLSGGGLGGLKEEQVEEGGFKQDEN